MRPSQFSVLGLLLSASFALSQQVGVVDLTVPGASQASAKTNVAQLAPGCIRETAGIMADGAVVPEDGLTRRISLEIVKLSSDTLQVGGEGRAEVRLRNVGETAIQIPWSKDSSLIGKAPNPDYLEWEQGALSVVLIDKENRTIALKSVEQPLFGSQFVAGSQITIKPGEWITAFLSFKVEDEYHIRSSTDFPIGDAKLSVEWEQARREWSHQKCAWNRAWFDYRDYYRQDRRPSTVQIKRPDSDDNARRN